MGTPFCVTYATNFVNHCYTGPCVMYGFLLWFRYTASHNSAPMDSSTQFLNSQLKIPLHKVPADVRCDMLPCCHIALNFIGFLLQKLFIFRMYIKGYIRDDVCQRIDWRTTLVRIFRLLYTCVIFTHIRNTYRLCIIRFYN